MARHRAATPQPEASLTDRFRDAANRITRIVGTPWAMLLAAAVIVVWAVSGPLFGFSDTWQLVINTGTTIVTFLMVFAIQTSQNRESKAVQLKLDELIRATPKARDRMMDEEDAPEADLERDEAAMKRRAHATGRRRPRR
ncbi:MAG: low affinity iron permease family protein [Candidatus Limnocylindria bacterium]